MSFQYDEEGVTTDLDLNIQIIKFLTKAEY